MALERMTSSLLSSSGDVQVVSLSCGYGLVEMKLAGRVYKST